MADDSGATPSLESSVNKDSVANEKAPSSDPTVLEIDVVSGVAPILDPTLPKTTVESGEIPIVESTIPKTAVASSETIILNPTVPEIVVTKEVTPSLDAAVPKIVITEPSPFHQSSSAVSIPSASDVPPESIKGSSEVISVAAKPIVAQQISAQLDSDDSSDEYSQLHECVQCPASAPEPVAELRIDVDTEPESEQDDLRVDSRCCPQFCLGDFREFGYRYVEVTDSDYWMILWFLTMAVPISAGFMGAKYLNECKMSSATPALLFIIGITGVIMITTRILVVLSTISVNGEPVEVHPCLQIIGPVSFVLTMIIFATELMAFWRFSPSFDELSPQYCDPTFYTYTYWINWTTTGLMAIWFANVVIKCIVRWRRRDVY